jgi:hypothetical protein
VSYSGSPDDDDDGQHPDLSALARLARLAGLPEHFTLKSLEGGSNNRVFRVQASDRFYLLKWYFSHPDDARDRLAAEVSFSQFAWQAGIRSLPKLLAASPDEDLALFEFIEGSQLSSADITRRHLQAAIDFYMELNLHRAHPAAANVHVASEACFRVKDHLACVENRIQRLVEIDPLPEVHRDAAEFVKSRLVPAWNSAIDSTDAAVRRFDLPPNACLKSKDRCLSPSDFGFHNAIIDAAGTVRFIDFEYAGWDDPAKMVCDFFCQIAAAVPRKFFSEFGEAIASIAPQPAQVLRRIQVLFPIYQLKWCCILLNEFLPTACARRHFSHAVDNMNDRKKSQLAKADQLLSQMIEAPFSVV